MLPNYCQKINKKNCILDMRNTSVGKVKKLVPNLFDTALYFALQKFAIVFEVGCEFEIDSQSVNVWLIAKAKTICQL